MTILRSFAKSTAAILIAAVAITASYAAELKDITLVTPGVGIGFYPLHVAKGEKFFEQEGLNVTIESVSGSAQVLQMLGAGQAQLGNAGPGPTLMARENGLDAVAFYNYFVRGQFSLMVPADSTVQSPLDLKGKRIGVGTADGAEVAFVRSILNEAGLTEGTDYEFLVVGDGGLAAVGFFRKEIDAYASGTADTAFLNLRGVALRDITPKKFTEFFGNGFVATRAYIDANPDVIEGFGRALAKAFIFTADPANKAKALQYAAEVNPQESEDQDLAGALYDVVQGVITPSDPSKGWGYYYPEQWKAWEDALLASGSLKAPLADLGAAYTSRFVDAWTAGAKQ